MATPSEQPQGNWRPVPDPTVLTTEQLHREIAALEARIGSEVTALKTLLEASIRSMEAILDARTEILDTKVDAHEMLDAQRFDRLDARFSTIERNRVEQKEDTNKRLNYVIDTLKERADEHFKQNRDLIEKSERSIQDTIGKQADSFVTTTKALTDRHDDLKERVSKIESVGEGASAQRLEGREGIRSTTAVIGSVVAIIGIGLALLVGRNSHQTPPVVTVTTPTVTVPEPATTP